jgi:Cupin
VNGFACKANFTADDFSFRGLARPGATNNTYGSLVTGANVEKIPGLNTLGVSMSRIDYAPGGINPPHTHPRATEIIFVLEGTTDSHFFFSFQGKKFKYSELLGNSSCKIREINKLSR